MPPSKRGGRSGQGSRRLSPSPGSLTPQQQAAQEAESLRQQAEQLQIISASWQGQLPHPNDLRAYDELVPGIADRLLNLHVREREELLVLQAQQATHRESLEDKVTESNIANSRRGQRYAFAIVIFVLLICAFGIYEHAALEALIGILGSLATLAAVFVYGNERRVRELQEKWKSIVDAMGRGQGGG